MDKFKLADVDLYFNDQPKLIVSYLCAIGDYDEDDKECKEWDDSIFYWFHDEEELKDFKNKDETTEFTVLDYQIRQYDYTGN